MKRIIALLSIVTASAILLAGCATASGSSGPEVRNLSDADTMSALCGTEAAEVEATVAKAAAASPNSGLRNSLANWGVEDPTDDKAVASIQSVLSERAKVKDCTNSKSGSKDTKPSSAALSASLCPAAYQQVEVERDNGKVDSDFAAKYAAATAEANNLGDSQKTLLIEESGKNAQTLAAWSHAFGLYKDPSAWKALVSDNCLSSEGQKLHNQFEGALMASATKVEEGVAPDNGYNSGISNGTYGVDTSQGVSGDRKAIQITLKDGTVIWIMVRCANPVYAGKPNLPTVQTDNPPPTPPPVCPPGQHGTPPVCKDDPSKDSSQNGKATVVGGKNADPGPGTYVPPAQVQQPPATAYTPPPAPVAPAPAPTQQPDPAPAPPPEPPAPVPSAPATGCSPAPGRSC